MEEALDKTQASQLKGQSEPTERDFWLHLKALLSQLSAVGLTRGKTLQADDIKKNLRWATTLNDVVVIGYGTVRKKDLIQPKAL